MELLLARIRAGEQFWFKPEYVSELFMLLNRLEYTSGRRFTPEDCSHYCINYIRDGVRGYTYPSVISYNGARQGTELTPIMLYSFPIVSRRS